MSQAVLPFNQSKIEAAFWEFHREHPEVYEELRQLALDARRAGRRRIGMKMLFEVVRWNRLLRTGDRGFKLNNNYTAYYARLLMEREPELRGMFATRRLGVSSHVV